MNPENTRVGELVNTALAREGKTNTEGKVATDDVPLEMKAALAELFRIDMIRIIGLQRILSPECANLRREFDKLIYVLCPALMRPNSQGKSPIDVIGDALQDDLGDYLKGDKS
jgi:hypothetical protein